MDADGKAASKIWAALPQTEHTPLGPLGEIEQAAKFAAGLRNRRHGWRRVVAVAGFIFMAVVAAVVLVAGIQGALQH